MPDPKPIERTSPISQVNRVLDANVDFEMRPGGMGVGNGLRPTLCRSSESHLRQTHSGFLLPNEARCDILWLPTKQKGDYRVTVTTYMECSEGPQPPVYLQKVFSAFCHLASVKVAQKRKRLFGSDQGL